MITIFKSLQNGLTGWGRRSPKRNDHWQLPENVKSYLEKEYHLNPQDISNVRCVKQHGSFVGSPVQYIRIFNGTVKGTQVNDISYKYLDKHPELVMYEGHIYMTSRAKGLVYLKKQT